MKPCDANQLPSASLMLAMGAGHVRAEELHALVTVDRRFEPDPATRSTYDRLFAEFPKLHSRNKGMFARLNA